MAKAGKLSASTLLDALDDLFFAFDEAGTIELWNQAVPEVTGYSAADLQEMTPADFFTDEDADRVAEAIATLFDTGSAAIEAELVTASGERIPYEFKARRLPEGSELAFVGIGRDITARRTAEREREAILNRMGDAFLAVDTDWHLTYVNETGAQLLGEAMGCDPEETTFEGRNLWEAIPDAVDTVFYEEYHRAMEHGEAVAFEEYFQPLDTWFDVRAFPDDTGLSVYFRDITDQRQYREQLEHREQVLKDIYTIAADRDSSFVEQVRQLLALGRAELGTEYGSLSEIRGDDYRFEVVDAEDNRIQPGDTVPLEATNCELTASREETVVLGDIARDAPEATDRAGYTEWGISCYIGAPVFDDEGLYGTFCFYDSDPREGQFSDWEVTLVDLMSRWVSYELQRRHITERLQRHNERLEAFAGIISHDLRNPLGVLQGWLELAEESGDSEAFERCHTAVDRMETLIDNLLALSKAGATVEDVSPVAIDTVAEQAWELVATADATIHINSDDTIPADASRLQQLLENLFRNAIEHGGEDVTVTVGSLEDGFYIEDDGPGISEEDRDAVFEHGYSTADDGTGFGLAIVAEIVEAHDWAIRVIDGTEGGARFEITETGPR